VLPGKKYRPEDLIELAWRWKWLIVVPFVVVASATFVAARLVPDRYRSETVILVVPQRVPESYVRSTVTNRLEERLQTIQQQILSRTRLEQVIARFNLYPRERQAAPMEDVIERMRRDIEVQIVKGDSFRVAFISDSAQVAMNVTGELASLFINENVQDRQVQATATSDFLQSQLENARRRLTEQEQKVADYQRKHVGELPSERQANLQVLQNLQMQVQAIVESINRDKDRRHLIERSLADLTGEAPAATPAAPVISADDPTSLGSGSAAAQLEAARNILRAMELRYKPDYPDIKRWKRVIGDLEAKAQAEAIEKPLSRGAGPERPATPEEAARQKRINEVQAELDNLDLQLKSKEGTEKSLRNQIRAYEARVSTTPLREAEMIALTRDYDTLQKNYQSLLAKQEDSKVAANLEQRQSGEQFRVLDPARLPERPFSPNRPFIQLLGAMGGLGRGLGLVALIEYRDKSLRSEDDVLLCLSLPVLALVPVMTTKAERRRTRQRRVLASCAAVAFVTIAATGALAWKLGWLSRLIAR
jgi:polysaccharide chain length determinant protein (PEP-CTERM system associated)